MYQRPSELLTKENNLNGSGKEVQEFQLILNVYMSTKLSMFKIDYLCNEPIHLQ